MQDERDMETCLADYRIADPFKKSKEIKDREAHEAK